MPRRFVLLCGLVPALALPSVAQASDASMIRALAPYKATLTTDIILLAETNSVPTKSTAASVYSHLKKVQSDLATVARIARGQSPSSAKGRTAQSQVLTALSDAYGAAGDGLAAVAAVQAGKTAAARTDIANEQAMTGRSLPYFEASGKALGLFNG
jgi:hypothetical protein